MTTAFIIVIVSLLFSAFFSGVEIAFVSADRFKFEIDKQSKSLTTSIVNFLLANPQQFISTILVGNNIALVIYGLQMAKLLEPSLSTLSSNAVVVLVLQTLISTAIVLLTGEFLPKTISRINPNFWLNTFALPILACYIVLYPIARFSTLISMSCLRLLGVKDKATSSRRFTRADLSYWFEENLDNMDEHHVDSEVKYFKNALDFSSVRLRDCMIPRNEIIALEENVTLDELKNTFIESGLSKIIIFRSTIDNIVGYIHTSEMFRDAAHWRKHIIPIPIVPETMPANRLMELLVKKKKSMAVVVDEFGGTSGIVTREDILEEIVGEIEDEHDNNSIVAKQDDAHSYTVSGRMEIDAFNAMFDRSIPESEDYVTIAGMVLHAYEDFPKTNQVIQFEGFKVQVLMETNNKLQLLKLTFEESND